MNTERTTPQELRAKIDVYRAYMDSAARDLPRDAIPAALGHLVDAWQAAYLWHVGITQVIDSRSISNTTTEQYDALMRERTEGMTLVRERLA